MHEVSIRAGDLAIPVAQYPTQALGESYAVQLADIARLAMLCEGRAEDLIDQLQSLWAIAKHGAVVHD